MAKKVVATLRTSKSKSYAKVIKMTRSEKTGAYTFQENMVPSEDVNQFIKGK